MRRALLAFAAIVAFVAVYGSDRALSQQSVAPYRYGESPVVFIPNIDNIVTAYQSLLHYWTFGDSPGGTTPGPCATQLADSVGNDTVASPTPSPVPLDCSTPTTSPDPVLGATGMVQDGTTSAELTNGIYNQTQYFDIDPTAGTGVFSQMCNSNAGGVCTNSFSVSCVVEVANLVDPAYFFSADGTTTGLDLGFSMTGGLLYRAGSGSSLVNNFALTASGIPYIALYSFNSSTGESDIYLNGVQVMATTSPKPASSPNSETYFGTEGPTTTNGWNGRLEKCALWGIALAPADARLMFGSTGFW